jgi:hypothetical protein
MVFDLRHQTVLQALFSFVTRCYKIQICLDNQNKKIFGNKVTDWDKANKLMEVERGLCSNYDILKFGFDGDLSLWKIIISGSV